MTTQQITLLIAINALVFWKAENKKEFLWILAAVIDFVIGLLYASTDVQWSMAFDFGLMIAILGLYCLTMFFLWAIGQRKDSNNKRKEG